MPLKEGDEADNMDIWLRIATHRDHIKNGRVSHAAFGGNAISRPATARPWDRELSGRLRSLAGSLPEIIKHAESFCEEMTKKGGGTKTFVGLIFARVQEVRRIYNNSIRSGVYFTPQASDTAHSDLTFVGWNIDSKPELERFNIWLSDLLQALYHPGQLQHFEALPMPEQPSPVATMKE